LLKAERSKIPLKYSEKSAIFDFFIQLTLKTSRHHGVLVNMLNH